MATNIIGVPAQTTTSQQQLTRLDGSQLARVPSDAQLRNGALVTGTVLNVTKDGGYLVNIKNGAYSQNLTARATLPLIVGQDFRAIWDNSGDTPVLRLSEKDFALLSKFVEGGEREVATALLSRGMPVTGEMISYVRMMWRKAGEEGEKLGSILELWARELPMTPGNMQILSWYMSLDKKELMKIWNKVRTAFKERLKNGEDPISALKNLMDGDDDVADFLKGHSMLSKPLKHGVDITGMAAAGWLVGEEDDPLMAKIWVSADDSQLRSWWRVGFELDGQTLDTISGEVESDAQSYVVGLRAEDEGAYQTLRIRRDALRRELEDIPMSLQYISVNKGKRASRTPSRSIDIKV